jgi:cell division protein ZapE
MQAALEAFADARLLCIDEFELDDVAQTRMAAMFLRELFDRPTVHVVTTSNTLPSDLGRGRFAAEAFQRDIGEIASAFEVVSIDGEDYRHRRWDELSTSHTSTVQLKDAVRLTWPELAEQLERVHPVHYAQIAARLGGLEVRDLDTIGDQAVALRLVHFVDKLYDQEVPLSVSANVPLSELFAASYRHGGYEKKYRRCLSRLHELVRETEARETGAS